MGIYRNYYASVTIIEIKFLISKPEMRAFFDECSAVRLDVG